MAKAKKKSKKLTAKKQSVKDLTAGGARSVKGGLASDRQPRAVKLT
jgi:hypothetical protein